MPFPCLVLTDLTATGDPLVGPGYPKMLLGAMPIANITNTVTGAACIGNITTTSTPKILCGGKPAVGLTSMVTGTNPATGVPVPTTFPASKNTKLIG